MDHPFNLFSRLSLPPSLHYPCCDELPIYPCCDELPIYPCCDELPIYPCCDDLPVYPCCDELPSTPAVTSYPSTPAVTSYPSTPAVTSYPSTPAMSSRMFLSVLGPLAYPYISYVHTERIEGGGGGLPFSQPHSQASPGGVAISCSIPHLLLGQKFFKHQAFEI